MPGLTDLPEDILLRTISFLSPPEIIGLRQVSKTLYPVTYHPVVWIRAYKSAALPRPPGPYLRPGDKEGLMFLERALVQSAKLEPWTARNLHPHAVHSFPNVGNWMNDRHFTQWGSWLITITESSVVYRNLNPDEPQTHVLFRLDDSSGLGGLNRILCADTVTLAGHPITYVLLEARNGDDPLTLLKIVGHFRSSLSLEVAIPLSYPRHYAFKYMTASPRYICIYADDVSKDGEFSFALLDVTTEKIYHLPPYMSTLAPEILEDLENSRCAYFLLTDTHILTTFNDFFQHDKHIQAFRLPSEAESGATVEDDGNLRMTHEGICQISESPEWVLCRNKVTNVGGVQTTEIRVMIHDLDFMDDSGGLNEDGLRAIDLTLTASSSPGIGTITLSQRTPVIYLKDEWLGFLGMEISEDGFGRGMFIRGGDIQTFSMDASGPVCRVDFGPRRDAHMLNLPSYLRFDAWSGKVYYVSCDSDLRVHTFV